MIGWIIIVLVILAIAAVIGLIIYFNRGSKTNIAPDAPIYIKFTRQDSKGHVVGFHTIPENISEWEARDLGAMYPIDLQSDVGNLIDPGVVEFPFRKEKRWVLPRGVLSRFRDIIMIMPESSTDLDEGFRNTTIGAAFCNAIELANIKDKAIVAIRERNLQEKGILATMAQEENKMLKQYQGMVDKLIGEKVEEAKEKK